MLGKRPEGLPESVFVHSLALVESKQIGENTRVWAFAHVMSGASVGSHCNLGESVFVEAGAVIGDRVTVKNGISVWDLVTIEDDVFLGPHMIFTNDMLPRAFLKKKPGELLPTVVRRGATIGAGAVIVCGIELGEYCFVAAGAVVTRSIPPFGVVRGNPARLSGLICKCTETRVALGSSDSPVICPRCHTELEVGEFLGRR